MPHFRDLGSLRKPPSILVRDRSIGIGKFREFSIAPVEGARIDNYPSYRVAMPTDIFCCRQYDNIGTILNRTYESDSGGIINNERNPIFMGDFRYDLEIGNVEFGISDRLGINRSGP